MFASESQLQKLVHENPGMLLSGIPDLNPEYCSDAPVMISLGREIRLSSGQVDNLFIDSNGILTFVECKRYDDARLKREVYPQALNYAADLQAQLVHYDNEDFETEFFRLINSGHGFDTLDTKSIIERLSEDPLLERKDRKKWRRQFRDRLEANIKHGICRIIILCAPTPSRSFAYPAIRNLMQVMSFTEHSTGKFDLILMDLREAAHDRHVARIIWRRFAALPQISLIAKSGRDRAGSIERMQSRLETLPENQRQIIDALLDSLADHGFIGKENSQGFALYVEAESRSTYVRIAIENGKWRIIRRELRPREEELYRIFSEKTGAPWLNGIKYSAKEKKTTYKYATGNMLEVTINPGQTPDISSLVRAVKEISFNGDYYIPENDR